MTDALDELEFKGKIVSGIGKFKKLAIPGRSALGQAPSDWPESFYKGSLNVRIAPDGYPAAIVKPGTRPTVTILDSREFAPAFTISHDRMAGNLLAPSLDMANRGTAQAWRALLLVGEHQVACWVFRRIGSKVGEVLELVSEEEIRKRCGTEVGQDWPAIVRMFGRWI